MRLLYNSLIAIITVAFVTGCDDSDGSNHSNDRGEPVRSETSEWSGQVAFGGEVEVKGIGGDVTFMLGVGDDVHVEAVKNGWRNDPSTVTMEVVEHAGGVRICAIYPDVPGQAPNSCTEGGNNTSWNNDVEVDFTVRIPPGLTLEAGMVGGDLTALGIENEVILRTIGGDIVISTTEIAEASTFGGNITVTIGSTDPGRNLVFNTLSGNVTVTVPAAVNAIADVTAFSGTVSSDFPLTLVGPNHLQGTLGAGGSTLTLSSSSGNARLLRGP